MHVQYRTARVDGGVGASWMAFGFQLEAGMLMLLLVAVTALGAMAGVLVFILLEWDV